jgi:hypothetical protein
MSQLPEPPESFPVNALVPIDGTPLGGNEVRSCVGFDWASYGVHAASQDPRHPEDGRDGSHCSADVGFLSSRLLLKMTGWQVHRPTGSWPHLLLRN